MPAFQVSISSNVHHANHGQLVIWRGSPDVSTFGTAAYELTLKLTPPSKVVSTTEGGQKRDEAYMLSVPSHDTAATITATSTLSLFRALVNYVSRTNVQSTLSTSFSRSKTPAAYVGQSSVYTLMITTLSLSPTTVHCLILRLNSAYLMLVSANRTLETIMTTSILGRFRGPTTFGQVRIRRHGLRCDHPSRSKAPSKCSSLGSLSR